MYDYLLSFNTKQDAITTLSSLDLTNGNDLDRSVATEVQMIQQEGAYDQDGVPILPWKFYPGYHIQLFSKDRDTRVETLPQCRIGASRELLKQGQFFIIYKASDFNEAMLQIKIIGGYFTYPFGAVNV